MVNQKVALTVEEAAEICGIGRTSLYCAIRDGKLIARKAGRRTIILMADLQNFLDALPIREIA